MDGIIRLYTEQNKNYHEVEGGGSEPGLYFVKELDSTPNGGGGGGAPVRIQYL
jgi:hypothetical protein